MLSNLFQWVNGLSRTRRKSLGEWCMLGSALFILPLLMLDAPGVIVKVVLQLLWLAVLGAGFWLVSQSGKQ